MSGALIVIVVALGDADDPATRAMTRTTQEVLGEPSIVVVREVPAMPSDAIALELEAAMHAGALVELVWSADRKKATLRVHARDGGWSDRTVAFAAGDVAAERGRTLAYNVGIMVPPPAPPEPPERAPRARPAQAPAPETLPTPPLVAPPTRSPLPLSMDLAARWASSAGEERRALGFAGGVAFVPRAYGARLSVALRESTLDSASAATTTLQLGIGAILLVRPAPFVELAFRPEISATRVALHRPAIGGAPSSSDARWLPFAALTAEVGAVVPGGSTVFLAIGAERALGLTNVHVGDADAGALARSRLIGELGVRVRF